MIDIWANINRQLEEFNKQKRSLKPGYTKVEAAESRERLTRNIEQTRFANRQGLPAPPPRRDQGARRSFQFSGERR